MTTAPARRPSPADMPHRPAFDLMRPARTEELGEPFRLLYERAMARSGMHPHTRLVGLVLAAHGDWATGSIPADAQPHLEGLTVETGLHTPQVVVALNTLRSRGWISRPHGVRWERADVQLSIPHVLLKRLQRK